MANETALADQSRTTEWLGEHTALYESMVDGLRRAGWSRFDAEGEALGRIENLRAKTQKGPARRRPDEAPPQR